MDGKKQPRGTFRMEAKANKPLHYSPTIAFELHRAHL